MVCVLTEILKTACSALLKAIKLQAKILENGILLKLRSTTLGVDENLQFLKTSVS
jgi:hypothetical protein